MAKELTSTKHPEVKKELGPPWEGASKYRNIYEETLACLG